jgi:hypothetical protein
LTIYPQRKAIMEPVNGSISEGCRGLLHDLEMTY